MDDAQTLRPLLRKLVGGQALTEQEAYSAFEEVMSGRAGQAQIGALLTAMECRDGGPSVDEIVGAARAMRQHVVPVQPPEGVEVIDTCGTGGDALGTFNVSTGAALVTAACGVPVAKHGNRAISSRSGSADVLAALGVNIDADMALVKRSIWEAGIGFLMAPRHHGAMRHVVGPRVELGTRTIFNFLGPLSNPAGVKRQLAGVFARQWIEPMAQVLGNLGSERAWVVHGSDGIDELTTTGPSHVAELKDGKVSTFEVTPEDAGLPRAAPEDLKGGDPETNAGILRGVLDGAPGPIRDIVILNTAGALIAAGKAESLAEGAALAAAAIDDGKAKVALEKMVAITNSAPPGEEDAP